MKPTAAVEKRRNTWHVQASMVRCGFALWLVLAGRFPSAAIGQDRDVPPADLVLRGGRIVTMDDEQPEVQALAIRGDRIVAAGGWPQIESLVGEATRLVQIPENALVIPGFIEGHGHFTSLGQSLRMLDLADADRFDDIVAMVEAAAAEQPAGTWIVGRGWHQAKWEVPPDPDVQGYPVHHALSAVSPNHPVLLTHASGHMSLANAEAMRLAGVDRETESPAGGEILRDADGAPTGVFRETAQGLVGRARAAALAERSPEQVRQDLLGDIERAERECLRHGVTSFQDAGSSFATIDVLAEQAREGELDVRLWVMVRDANQRLAQLLPRYRMIGAGDDFLTVRAIKRSIDGALGPHGAWLLEPYEDLPMSTGLNTTSLRSLRETARLALMHDFQLCVHAIGDRANRETLDLFEEITQQHPDPGSLRWRVEHAQHLHPDDIPRFAERGVIASMQGVHCTSDAVFVIQRLGERRASQGAYVWRDLMDSGAVVTNGTDVPVERIDPLASYYASVTRRLPGGVEFYPEQRMSRTEALASYTRNAAYAAFEEDLKGSLTVGKLADIVILDRDILTIPDEEILETRVLVTFVGGEVKFHLADE